MSKRAVGRISASGHTRIRRSNCRCAQVHRTVICRVHRLSRSVKRRVGCTALNLQRRLRVLTYCIPPTPVTRHLASQNYPASLLYPCAASRLRFCGLQPLLTLRSFSREQDSVRLSLNFYSHNCSDRGSPSVVVGQDAYGARD